MVDSFTKGKRSDVMRRVRGADTTPERCVRRMLRELGYRYRLNVRSLPGAPDVVVARARAAVFVHGCFWHQHACARGARRPSSNDSYWNPKLERTVQRDKLRLRELRRLGWRCLVVWECELRSEVKLQRKLAAFLTRSAQRAPRNSE